MRVSLKQTFDVEEKFEHVGVVSDMLTLLQ